MKRIKKRTSEAFGKKVYLLGKINGEYLWLEEGKWDCDWYWGFGQTETYTNNRHPHLSRDISSHTHWDGHVGVKKANNEYVSHFNEVEELEETVLTETESWKLSDLMQSFYTLRKAAELFHQGGSNLTTVEELSLKNKSMENKINGKLIPKIMEQVYKILEG